MIKVACFSLPLPLFVAPEIVRRVRQVYLRCAQSI